MNAEPNNSSANADQPLWYADSEVLAGEFRTYLGRSRGLNEIQGYEIGEQISRGGQGRVFAAIDQRTAAEVAVKVLTDGVFGSGLSRERFEREIEIATDLKHPCIVEILNHGVTGSGLMYLVMPRINGVQIDLWAKTPRNAGRVESIIELFVTLCETIQFAHQLGIIHRDLKPANVLVDNNDRPQILDFGLAKSFIDSGQTSRLDQSITQESHFVGSMPWTSPEQLSGNRSQIGVSTDIYAIGVMLYQALTGQFPYRVEGAIPKVIDDVLNALPTRPSEFNPKISANLDAVVLKALEKSPDTRYSSATDFARDLQSLLDGEPILAVRERTRRNLVNAIRRYRLLTGALVVFIGVVTILYSQAHTDRSIAKRESLKAHASSEFLVDLLAEVDPRRRGVDVTVAEVLNKAAIDIPNRFADQPEVQSTLEFMLCRAYSNLGLFDLSNEHGEKALRQRQAVLGVDHLDAIEVEFFLATSSEYFDADRSKQMLTHVVEQRRRQLGDCHSDTLTSEFYHLLANIKVAGSLSAVIEQLDALSARANKCPEVNEWILNRILSAQLQFKLRYGNISDAIDGARALVARLSAHPDSENEYRLNAMRLLAEGLFEAEQYDEAKRLIKAVADVKQRVLGPTHPANDVERIILARIHLRTGNLQFAKLTLDQISDSRTGSIRSELGILDTKYSLLRAEILLADGHSSDALDSVRTRLEHLRASIGEDHFETHYCETDFAYMLASVGSCREGDRLAKKLLKYFEFEAIADHRHAQLLITRSECLVRLGRREEARSMLKESQRILVDLFGGNHSLIIRVQEALRKIDNQKPGN